ncbi:MAG: FAD binding domain-containing protein [Blautia marasmi]
MSQITETEDMVVIGAGVTMTELEQSPVIRTWIPALAKAASMVGSIRPNRATGQEYSQRVPEFRHYAGAPGLRRRSRDPG